VINNVWVQAQNIISSVALLSGTTLNRALYNSYHFSVALLTSHLTPWSQLATVETLYRSTARHPNNLATEFAFLHSCEVSNRIFMRSLQQVREVNAYKGGHDRAPPVHLFNLQNY
jgi:hypothetical protein